MAGEGTFPKSPGDILYASEVNVFNATSENKTSYWTCQGNNFSGVSPDINDIQYYGDSARVASNADGIALVAPIKIPNGAVITKCVVYGNAGASAEVWYLLRTPIDSEVGELMATANINTEDTTITSGTIDNSAYSYGLSTSTIDTGDIIYGARIEYTKDYRYVADNVTAAANLTDNAIVRGNGGAKGVQTSTATITDAGEVGIGTASPVARTEIKDNGYTGNAILKITTDDRNPWGLVIGNDTWGTAINEGLGFFQEDTGESYIYCNGSDSIVLDPIGNVLFNYKVDIISDLTVDTNTLFVDATNNNVGMGTITPDTSSILDLTSTAGALLLSRMTTTQKNALTPVNGMVVYDSTLNKFQGYENGGWANLI